MLKGAEGGGGGWRRRLCRRVVKEKVLKIDGPFRAQGFLSLTALRAEGCGLPLRGNAYKVSVTGVTFSVIGHENNSADWLAALASPYPASPDFPRSSVGQSKGRPFYGQAKGLL